MLESGSCGAVIASATTEDLDPKGYKIAIESMDTPHQLLHPSFERWIKNEWISNTTEIMNGFQIQEPEGADLPSRWALADFSPIIRVGAHMHVT